MYEISGRTGLRSLTWLLYGLDRTKERHAPGEGLAAISGAFGAIGTRHFYSRCAYGKLGDWLENPRNENGNENASCSYDFLSIMLH
jgi:hypothetical protein